MAIKAETLSALAVGRLKTPELWAVGGVAGLYLAVNQGRARSWVLRVVIGTKRRDMGLGGFSDVTLEQARHFQGHHTPDRIGRATGWIRDDDAHRSGGPSLRLS